MPIEYRATQTYEVCYRNALLILAEKYDSVGDPYLRGGQRVCRVESLVSDDRTVLLLAWGIKVADEIEHRLKHDPTSQISTKSSSVVSGSLLSN
jgi:hypothetical protein